MLAYGSAVGIEVHAPAKLNLFLEVVSKRDDGYHEIETLIAPIRLFDTLYFREIPAEVSGSPGVLRFSCQVTHPAGDRDIPTGADNLAVRAVELLRQRAGVDRSAEMRLVKRIPAAAGFGGASSDAAAALVAANQAWGLGRSHAQLASLAAELGSDVPFFVGRGPAICRGRGEQIERLRGLGNWYAVLVCPPDGLSTPEVYSRCQPSASPRTAQPLVAAMTAGRSAEVGRYLHNQLQPAAAALSPWVDRIQHTFDKLDCPAHQLTGSGTAYFGLCRHARHARRLAELLRCRLRAHAFDVRLAG